MRWPRPVQQCHFWTILIIWTVLSLTCSVVGTVLQAFYYLSVSSVVEPGCLPRIRVFFPSRIPKNGKLTTADNGHRYRKRFEQIDSRIFFSPNIYYRSKLSQQYGLAPGSGKLIPDPDPRVKKAPDPEHGKPSPSSLIMLFYWPYVFLSPSGEEIRLQNLPSETIAIHSPESGSTSIF
jgi:hypothetical protein